MVVGCTVEDASELASNNIPAFWGETWYNMLWLDRPLSSVVDAAKARMPTNLLTDRPLRRHQKVVDPQTGKILGYARWILSPSLSESWLEAQIPDVSDAERKEYDVAYAAADWKRRTDIPDFDTPILKEQAKYNPRGPYFSMQLDINDPVSSILLTSAELDYLAVNTDAYRRGVGSLLVSSGIAQAERLGADMVLIAMGPKALGLYKKLGFEMRHHVSQDLRPWGHDDTYETYFMIRHAGQGSD